MKIAVILMICRAVAGNAGAAKYNETLVIPPNGSVSADFSLLPDEDAALTFEPGDAPKGYCYKDMDISFNQKEGFCWVGSFYIINTEYKNAAATVTATCTWIPCGEGGGGSGVPPPPITGTGIGIAVAQPGTYWNSAEGNNVLSLGGTAEVFAFKDDGEFADSTWSHSAKLSFKEENLISVKTVGEAASDSAWDSKVHSVSHDYPDLSDDEPFTVVSVFSIEAEPDVVCIGHEHIAYTITTQPEGFNHMVDYTPANTSEPGIKEVIATCGTSAVTTTVTVVKVEIAGSPQIADDGFDTETYFECIVTPDDLEATYQWSADWPTPAYNDPQVSFTLPTDSITRIRNAWWYTTSTDPCDRSAAQYDIYCTVTINGFSCRNRVPGEFFVDVGGEDGDGGKCEPPDHTMNAHYNIIQENGQYVVLSIAEPWERIDAKIINYHPSTSQFYDKVQAHEQQHKDDYDNGFDGYVFINTDEFAQIVVGLTAPTEEELKTILQIKLNEYIQAEIEEMNSLLPVLEERAYAVSDNIPPFYVYQSECGGLE